MDPLRMAVFYIRDLDAETLDFYIKHLYLGYVVKGTTLHHMKKTQKREMSPAQIATLMKVAELRTKGSVSTCDFYSGRR